MSVMEENKIIIINIIRNQVNREKLKETLHIIINEEIDKNVSEIDALLIMESVDTLCELSRIDVSDINIENIILNVKKTAETLYANEKTFSITGFRKRLSEMFFQNHSITNKNN